MFRSGHLFITLSFLIIKTLRALCSVAYKHFLFISTCSVVCTFVEFPNAKRGSVLLSKIPVNFRQNSVLSKSGKNAFNLPKSTEQVFDAVRKRGISPPY